LLVAPSAAHLLFSFLLLRPPPSSTLFPYTTLFRSYRHRQPGRRSRRRTRRRAARHVQLDRKPIGDGNALQRGFDQRMTACQPGRSEEHTSELQSLTNIVCRLLLEKKKTHHLATDRT